MPIKFYFESPTTLSHRIYLKKFIEEIFVKEKRSLKTLNYVFCSDKFLLDINRRFLNHDFYTDIITFDLGNQKSEPIYGEIYISVERVAENAKFLNVSVLQELHRVIFHGVLHLCGYQDKTTIQKKLMRKKEDYYLKQYEGNL